MSTAVDRMKESTVAICLCCLTLSGCVSAGKSGTAISGSAAGSTDIGVNKTLEHCDQTFGTLAIDDGRNATWYSDFAQATKVTTVEPLIRLAVQQSNCFAITSIGNIHTDSRLNRITKLQRNSGEYRAGSNQQKGQRVAADYYLEPQIIINNSPVGSVTGTVAGGLSSVMRFPVDSGIVSGLVSGGLGMKSSVVTLSLFDIRSSLQISISEGSAQSNNFDAAIRMFTEDANVRLGGFKTTPEGMATVAAFLDSYNEMVRALKVYKAQEVSGGLGRGGLLKVN